MKVLGLLDTSKKYTNDQISNLFNANVKVGYVSESGDLTFTETESAHPVFLRVSENQLVSYAVPVSGYGL